MEQVFFFFKEKYKIWSWAYWLGVNRAVMICFLGGEAPLSVSVGMVFRRGSVNRFQQGTQGPFILLTAKLMVPAKIGGTRDDGM